jgi:hypothetical protein
MTRTASDIISNPKAGDRIARVGEYGFRSEIYTITGVSGQTVQYETDTGFGSFCLQWWRSLDAKAMQAA